MPGTELAFGGDVACLPTGLFGWKTKTINHQTAIFRQINKEKLGAHHDALEFPDGRTVLLTFLCEDQAATVLQLPAQPATTAEAQAQKRVTYVGCRLKKTWVGRLRKRPTVFAKPYVSLGYFLPCASKWAFTASSACPLP